MRPNNWEKKISKFDQFAKQLHINENLFFFFLEEQETSLMFPFLRTERKSCPPFPEWDFFCLFCFSDKRKGNKSLGLILNEKIVSSSPMFDFEDSYRIWMKNLVEYSQSVIQRSSYFDVFFFLSSNLEFWVRIGNEIKSDGIFEITSSKHFIWYMISFFKPSQLRPVLGEVLIFEA